MRKPTQPMMPKMTTSPNIPPQFQRSGSWLTGQNPFRSIGLFMSVFIVRLDNARPPMSRGQRSLVAACLVVVSGLRLDASAHSADSAADSPVTIRLLHRKRIRQMPDFTHFAVRQQHLDDVEPDFHRRIFQQPQIIQRRLRKQPPFARIHRRRRARPILGRPGFDLDKRQAIVVAKDQINLAAFRTEIGREKFQPRRCRCFFAARSPSSPRRRCSGFSLPVNRVFNFSSRFIPSRF